MIRCYFRELDNNKIYTPKWQSFILVRLEIMLIISKSFQEFQEDSRINSKWSQLLSI